MTETFENTFFRKFFNQSFNKVFKSYCLKFIFILILQNFNQFRFVFLIADIILWCKDNRKRIIQMLLNTNTLSQKKVAIYLI